MERFADYMVKDTKSGQCFRADHLIEGEIQSIASSIDYDNKNFEFLTHWPLGNLNKILNK